MNAFWTHGGVSKDHVMGFVKKVVCEGISLYERERDYGKWRHLMIENLGEDSAQFLKDAFQWSMIYHQTRSGPLSDRSNCWDVMNCGQGTVRKGRKKVCAACSESLLNGIHGGIKGGRACWALDRTVCGGKLQPRYETKQDMCSSCSFFRQVRDEEGADHIIETDHIRLIVECS